MPQLIVKNRRRIMNKTKKKEKNNKTKKAIKW